MQSIELTAKTTDEAIELALIELDVERVEVEIEVISEGKSGILGMGGEPAKVKVTLLDEGSDLARTASDILENIVTKLDVDVVVNLRHAHDEDVGGPVFDVDGEDAGLLIGRRGETLRALQFLVSFIASKKLNDRVNLFIDVAGYQSRRYESLRALAHRVARRVVDSGEEIPLEAMPPNERRGIHMTLSDNSDVDTASEGTGEDRRVIVQPANLE